MAVALGMLTSHAAVKVDRIEPTNWYVGMKDPSVQLMVYGEGIRDAEVAIDYHPRCPARDDGHHL